jgi:hypothetical protein
MNVEHIRIKEKSLKAKVAAWALGVDNIAFTLGKTIYLHNASTFEFLHDEKWVKHELEHVAQFRKHGFVPFIFKYFIETLRKGYYNNKYEIEARQAERK